jgi:chemotaxis protein MotB
MAHEGTEKPQVRPIIIIKKKAPHAAHHGGAWKVAYADFVTAMMALFIVLWLVNTNKAIQDAVSGYFKDPKGFSKKVSSDMQGSGENFVISKDDMPRLKEELVKVLRQVPKLEKLKDQIEMTVTSEGLRIEMLESGKGTFFDSGNDLPTATGAELLSVLAVELGKLPNKLSIEGHTDSKPFLPKWDYSNWELSIERANAARRLMQTKGVRADQIAQIRGFADQKPRKPDKPRDDSNRRVSIIVQYLEAPPETKGPPAPEPGSPAPPAPAPASAAAAPAAPASAAPAKPAR